MLSRRSFLAASLGLLLQAESVLAKAKKPVELKKIGFGPRTLAREQWPPAISPDYISIVERGYALMADQSGRLAIVDLKREQGPVVIGELVGIGKKTLGVAVAQHRAYAIANQDSGTDSQNFLVTMSITPPNDPTVLSRIPITQLSEPTSIAASQDAVAVGGVGPKGENQVLLYGISTKKRPDENTVPLSTISFAQSVTRVDLQARQLIVLQSGPTTVLDVFNLFNPRDPQRVGGIKLEGNYSLISRTPDAIILGGSGPDKKLELISVAVRPTPKAVARLPLTASELLDIAMQRGQILVLANQINRQVVIPVTYNPKNLSMTTGAAASLPAGGRGAASKARIALLGKDAYVASDWGGVQVLNITNAGWQYLYSHTIPRLPAAAIAVAANRAVLAGADLKVYDISTPSTPLLIQSAELGGTVRGVTIAGGRILALTRNELSLRTLDQPGEVVHSLKTSAQTFAYDARLNRAYLISSTDKNTTITPVSVGRELTAGTPQQISGTFNRGAASNGQLLLFTLNNVALYSVAEDTPKLLGSRTFPNLAIRDAVLLGDLAVASAIDQNSRGFLLTINPLNSELPTLGSVDLPSDAVAIAVSGREGIVVGRGGEGKDLASLIDMSSSVAPKVMQSFPVLEAASAVAIKDQIALVVGRGLEILSLA